MICAYLGEDSYTRLNALEAAVDAALGPQKDDPLARQVLYAGEASTPDVGAKVIESCSVVSMFGPQLAVILRRVESLRADDAELLSTWLLTKPDCLLFIEGGKVDGRTEFSKVLRKVGNVQEYKVPSAYKMPVWIQDHCRTSFRKTIAPDAAAYLADALGNELGIVHSELEKIVNADPAAKGITLEIAQRMVVPQRDMSSFELVKPFGDRDAQAFVQTLQRMSVQGLEPVPVNHSLFTHAVRLMHVQTMMAQKRSSADMAKACGMMDWMFEKTDWRAQVAKWPTALLAKVIMRLGEMDFEIKVGRYPSKTEYELALCALIVR